MPILKRKTTLFDHIVQSGTRRYFSSLTFKIFPWHFWKRIYYSYFKSFGCGFFFAKNHLFIFLSCSFQAFGFHHGVSGTIVISHHFNLISSSQLGSRDVKEPDWHQRLGWNPVWLPGQRSICWVQRRQRSWQWVPCHWRRLTISASIILTLNGFESQIDGKFIF